MAATATTSSLSTTIQKTLGRLRQLNTRNIQHTWQLCQQNFEISDLPTNQPDIIAKWPVATLNDKQHIAWDKGLNVLWLYQSITVPPSSFGYPLTGLTLRLALTWWAEDAQIYVDGTLVQSGDLFECFTRLCLSEKVMSGQVFQVAIRLVSPGHDEGALVRSQLIYELPPNHLTPEPSFIADEIEVLATLEPGSQAAIEHAIAILDWDRLMPASGQKDPEAAALSLWQNLSAPENAFHQPIPASVHPFQQSLSQLRRALKPFSKKIKARKIQCVGHAHLDMAWLWPIANTWEAAERTFRSIISLQEDFSELTFTHSSPALFEWLEKNRPALFKQIQQKVAEGSWSIDAGLWIEPEFNIISGESIARQILYGQRYCQEKFGAISKIAWLPDSFGFCWQLPQLLTQGGIETFATLKLSWNDTTEFPHQLFWWQSPDGSRILSIMLPPIGTDIDPVKMANHADKWTSSTHLSDSIWLPGMGDHGGGPTRDMLEKARRWEKSPFFPNLSFTTPDTYIKNLPLANFNAPQLSPSLSQAEQSRITLTDQMSLPIWDNELYLELHRGCYTTHADQKKNNRQCEDLLYQAEVFASVAQLTVNKPYPKADIDTAWKALLFNQFHDILPGTSVPEVFIEANQGWQQVQKIAQQVLDESLSAISKSITFSKPPHPDAKPIIVFNSLSWSRTATVSIKPPNTSTDSWLICDTQHQHVANQITSKEGGDRPNILFVAKDIPAIGYRCFWIYPDPKPHTRLEPSTSQYILENRFIRATIDANSGLLISLIEKSTQTEAVKDYANQLQAFRDESGYWDAWNIAADYRDHPLDSPRLCSIQQFDSGSIRQQIRVVYQFNQSTISQDYVLDQDSPILKIKNVINWQETKTLLKVNFPTTVSSPKATYEIPFGAIIRSTNPSTTAEKAQWEVPALRWADIGDTQFGVSILTNAKHGFDAGSNHLRLTLLKSPTWPDPLSDKGIHQFTYAIYAHPRSWQSAKTTQLARELNIPIIVHQPPSMAPKSHSHPHQRSFLKIHNPNLILSAFKIAEDHPHKFILRCYEAHGMKTEIKATNTLEITNLSDNHIQAVNLLEKPVEIHPLTTIEPWQIVSYQIRR